MVSGELVGGNGGFFDYLRLTPTCAPVRQTKVVLIVFDDSADRTLNVWLRDGPLQTV